MKPQDLFFLGVLVILFFFRKPKLFVSVGLISLVLAMPFFYFHIFFTAERLTWYAAAFFLVSVILNIFQDP